MRKIDTSKNGRVRTRRAPAEAPTVIGFRLNEDESAALADDAKDKELSPHRLAHDIVVEKLRGKESTAATSDQVQALSRQLFTLREELALVAEALLVASGKSSLQAAKEWVDKNLAP
jgi:hypothetical protein